MCCLSNEPVFFYLPKTSNPAHAGSVLIIFPDQVCFCFVFVVFLLICFWGFLFLGEQGGRVDDRGTAGPLHARKFPEFRVRLGGQARDSLLQVRGGGVVPEESRGPIEESAACTAACAALGVPNKA